eukprot:380156-Rhodomonas_salina.1
MGRKCGSAAPKRTSFKCAQGPETYSRSEYIAFRYLPGTGPKVGSRQYVSGQSAEYWVYGWVYGCGFRIWGVRFTISDLGKGMSAFLYADTARRYYVAIRVFWHADTVCWYRTICR